MAAPALMSALAAVSIGCGGAGERAPGTPAALAQRADRARATPTALRVVRAAAGETLVSPAAVEFRLDGSRTLGSSPAPVFGSGEFDFPSGTGSETIDLGESKHQEPGTEHVIFLPSRVYLQPKSSSATVLPKGKAWMSATLTGSDSVHTNFPSFVLQVEGVNPQLLLAELAGGAVRAVPVGQEAINGEHARAYDVTVDLARALSASTGPTGAAFGQAIQSELGALGGGRSAEKQGASIRTWIDDSGHVIQMRASPPGAGVGAATMTMCCFGLPAAVALPSPSQVLDITSLTPSGERENNGGGDSDGG
ncbi:MAG TPA: hypothetical protein VFV03_06650 [Solirubrobacteraceae bacterium]|nr:hypothetical protein [Solirubrobacteraceae bacterium]